ncbi:hypothetical protein BH09VER1_BH09VER1_26090 [soil metagenome]
MKCALLLLLSSLNVLAGASYETMPVTGADVAQALELNPSNYQINKTLIEFDHPKHATFRYSSLGHTREIAISGVSPSLTLLTYVPKDGGPVKPLKFWVTGTGGAIYSSVAFDSSKVKYTKSGIVDGVFTIIASASKDFTNPEYTIQILTSDKRAN